jgi:hypothetical protein
LIKKIKNISFEKALKKILPSNIRSVQKEVIIHSIKTYLILFDGTDPEIREHFIRIQENFPPHTVKLLGFVNTESDVAGFNMALYNKKDIRWNFTPKQSILELVQSQACDMMILINPENYPHLHFLAVAANASFKAGTVSRFPNDLSLEVNAGDHTDPVKIYNQIMTILKTLSA